MRTLLLITAVLGLAFTMPSANFIEKVLFDGRVEVLIPEQFNVLDDEIINRKYPIDQIPNIVYANDNGTINIAFKQYDYPMTQKKIASFHKNYVTSFNKINTASTFVSDSIYVVNDQIIGVLEVITPAIDTKIYNFIFYTDVQGELLVCTFNCMEHERKDWQDATRTILKSLKKIPIKNADFDDGMNSKGN